MRWPMLPTPIQPIVSFIDLYSLHGSLGAVATLPATASRWRRHHHVRVGMALGDEAGVLEDVERRLEGWLGNLHVRRPIAELLVGGNGAREHREIDVREERCLRFGDLGGWCGEQPGARRAIGAHERLGRIGGKPFARRSQAREGAGATGIRERGDDVAGPVVLQLLWSWTLQMHIVPLPP